MARRLVKDRAAEADLIGIWVFSFETWGEAQADRYLDSLEQCIREILSDPRTGRQRDALREGYWSKSVGRHVVFYTFTDAEIRIRRVLHGVMDPERHV